MLSFALKSNHVRLPIRLMFNSVYFTSMLQSTGVFTVSRPAAPDGPGAGGHRSHLGHGLKEPDHLHDHSQTRGAGGAGRVRG